MKKFYILVSFVTIFLTSCVWPSFQEPLHKEQNPSPYIPSNSNTNNNGSTSGNSNKTSQATKTDSAKTEQVGSDTNTKEQSSSINVKYPGYFYDSCTVNNVLVFNVYIGYETNKAIIYLGNYSRNGGTIIINIYPNECSMSMYGFSKYSKDFYYFISDDTYCGYNSYSLNTQTVCKYKMIVTPNTTNNIRYCNGYWSCNDPSIGYSYFKLIIDQQI